jgi:hypothetical protein
MKKSKWRVDTKRAAAFANSTPENFRSMRFFGYGPPFYKEFTPHGGGRITYDLREVARWMRERVVRIVPRKTKGAKRAA